MKARSRISVFSVVLLITSVADPGGIYPGFGFFHPRIPDLDFYPGSVAATRIDKEFKLSEISLSRIPDLVVKKALDSGSGTLLITSILLRLSLVTTSWRPCLICWVCKQL